MATNDTDTCWRENHVIQSPPADKTGDFVEALDKLIKMK